MINKIRLDLATWASFMILATSTIIVAVCLPEISTTFTTNLAEGGGIETARSFVFLVVLLIAGVLAQRWGLKRFLTLGHYFLAAGFFLASLAENYAMLVAAIMVMGIGGGFQEALLNPLILAVHPRQSGKYLNIGHGFYPIGIVVAALLFGELLTRSFSWRAIFQIASGAALIIAILITVLRFPPDETEDTPSLALFTGILGLSGFWFFAIAIFLGASIESAFTFWSRSYVEVYLSDVPRAGAFAVVIFAAAMAVGRFSTAYLANRIGLNTIMIISAVLGIIVSGLVPFAGSLFWFYILLALAGAATACFWPSIMAEASDYLKVNSTILFVLLACMGIIGFGVTPWILGFIGDSAELRTGFLVIPVQFVGLILILFVQRRLPEQAIQPMG